MEITCSFPIDHGSIGVPTTIQDSNDVPIDHEALEFWIRTPSINIINLLRGENKEPHK
jgi:hypothetical protein